MFDVTTAWDDGKQTDRFSPSKLQPESESMSSYGQHTTSSSFQRDSALVAQFASYDHADRNPRPLAPSYITEEIAAWNDTIPHEPRPKRPTIGQLVCKSETISSPSERSPLLHKSTVSRINEGDGDSGHGFDYRTLFFKEVKTLAFYTLPVFG